MQVSYQGIVQLRNVDEEVTKYVLSYFEQERVIIAKEVKHKEGTDYFISSNKALLKLERELAKRFIGISKLTRKLFTQKRQTGKKVYRLTLLFGQLQYNVGDIIEDRGEQVKIVSIGKKVSVKDMKTGKKYFLSS